jgi:hypothetical protein
MKRIGQVVDAGIAVRQRLANHVPILDGDVAQPQQVSKHARHLLSREAVVATHDPLEFEDDRLADHQRLARLDQATGGGALPLRFGVCGVLDVMARQDVGVEPDHRLTKDAGSRSASTVVRRLFSMPNPLADSTTGELLTRMTA